jgi:hypothetical protein
VKVIGKNALARGRLLYLGDDRRRGCEEGGAEISRGSTAGGAALQSGAVSGCARQLGALMVDNSSENIWDCHCHEREVSW